jgi:hypothetical protein
MRKILLLATLFVLGLGVCEAAAATKTFSWLWPTARTDGTALALTGIGGAIVYDTSLQVPGLPGTVVACPVTIPPTTASGTCQANVTSGHTFGVVVLDTASPQDASVLSNTATVPFAAPNPATNFTVN